MIKRLVVLLLLSLPIFGQTNGYQFPATGATGLTVYLSPGSNTITGSVVNWSGGYLTMVRNSTNYAYIDSVTGAPTVNQTGFPTSSIPLFTATTNYFDVLTVTDSRVTYIGGGGSSGTSVSVNGSNVNTPNFNGTTPAAPANSANITYQVSGSSISGYMGAAGAGLGLTKSGACAGGSFADGTYNADGTPHCTAAAGSGTINAALQFSLPYYSSAGTTNVLSGVNGPTGPNGVPEFWVTTPSGGVATAPAPLLAGVPVNNNGETTCAAQTLNVLDRASSIFCSGTTTSTFTLPIHTTSGFGSNFPFVVNNGNSGNMTLSPTTDTIDRGTLFPNWAAWLYTNSSGNWQSIQVPTYGMISGLGSGKVVLGGGTTANPTAIDFPETLFIPAANCNNTTAGAGWSIGSGGTVTCRAGTNNKGGFISITDTSTTFATFQVAIPEDWDTGSNPFIRFQIGSTDTTTGHTIIPSIQVACYKGDGTTTDDVAANAAHSLSTTTLNTTANQFWSTSNVQMNGTDVTGCVAGGLMQITVGRATDTATNAEFYGATLTFPRLLTVQAN